MRRILVLLVALVAGCALSGPAAAAASSSVAALQVALRAQGQYPAVVDGVDGPMTRSGLTRFQQTKGIRATGKVGRATRVGTRPAREAAARPARARRRRRRLGRLVARVQADPVRARSGRRRRPFTAATAQALVRFQSARGLAADGIAGKLTFGALARRRRDAEGRALTPPVQTHVVAAGESFFSIAERYHVSPLLLAKVSGLELSTIIVPGQKLTLPAGAPRRAAPLRRAGRSRGTRCASSIDHWSAVYGVDPRLARATAWMESGFQQGVVSNVGAVGVMQLLPNTWSWVDQVLLGTTTPRTYDGNVRAGVRYLRWLLDQFGGDSRLALAGYYQGAQAVRDRGLFDDTKRYVSIILKLYGTV